MNSLDITVNKVIPPYNFQLNEQIFFYELSLLADLGPVTVEFKIMFFGGFVIFRG